MATLDGSAIFGFASSIVETPEENEHQLNQFFGINGQQSLFGGARGRTFACSGVLMASSPANIYAARQLIMNFADGQTHTLVDNFGLVWPNVIFKGHFKWTGLPKPAVSAGFGQGIGRPYQMVMIGLT